METVLLSVSDEMCEVYNKYHGNSDLIGLILLQSLSFL